MTYFITGGTGSFGSHFVKQHRNEAIVVYSRDEQKQYEMRKWAHNCTFVIGDVRDADRVAWAIQTYQPTYVIHAAALKHVRTGEEHPYECVRTNIAGTQNVVDAVCASDVDHAVILSTDKACEPVNLYGATKMVAERLWLSGNDRRKAFTAVRYGNVLGSRGSVLHVFGQYKKGDKFRIHDKRMTRFAVTLDYAVALVRTALVADPGTTLVSKVPALRITDLARAFDRNAEFEECGIGAGEKLAESLMTQYEMVRAIDLSDHYELPVDSGGEMPHTLSSYTSDSCDYLSVDELEEMVRVQE